MATISSFFEGCAESRLQRLRSAQAIVRRRVEALSYAAKRINIASKIQRKREDAFREAFGPFRKDRRQAKANARRLRKLWRQDHKLLYGMESPRTR